MRDLTIKTDQNFSFHSTLYSHGWSDLLPFKIDTENKKLYYSFELSPSNFTKIEISSDTANNIIFKPDSDSKDKDLLISKVKRIFRLDEDLTDFFEIAEQHKDYSWIIEKGAGRMLRCATLWEDMVKKCA